MRTASTPKATIALIILVLVLSSLVSPPQREKIPVVTTAASLKTAVDRLLEVSKWERNRVVLAEKKLALRKFFPGDPNETITIANSFPREIFPRCKELLDQPFDKTWEPKHLRVVNQNYDGQDFAVLHLTPAVTLDSLPHQEFYFFIVEGPYGDFSRGVTRVFTQPELSAGCSTFEALRSPDSLPEEESSIR